MTKEYKELKKMFREILNKEFPYIQLHFRRTFDDPYQKKGSTFIIISNGYYENKYIRKIIKQYPVEGWFICSISDRKIYDCIHEMLLLNKKGDK